MRKPFSMAVTLGFLLLLHTGQAFGLAITDVTFNGDNADAFYSVNNNNDNESRVNSAIGGESFVLLAKSDASSGISFNGVEFDLTTNGTTTGTFNLSWTGGTFPPSKWFDFTFAVKAGSKMFALYLFEDVEIISSSSAYSGTFAVTFVNGGGQYPKLSHLSVYGRPGDPGTPVPEPATMLLFGTGLAGLAGFARRKVQ